MGVSVTDIDVADLEELTGSKGWAWLLARFDAEWGPMQMEAHTIQIMKEVGDSHVKTSKIEQMMASKLAVRGFLGNVEREIARQRNVAQARPDELAAMRRRGAGL